MRKETDNRIGRNGLRRAKRMLRSALCVALSFLITGCSSILGDGEITVVTAPPIITPKVVVYDSYGAGDKGRFDIGGTDAFYLLPGIENYPDNMQDFNCLDYTSDGYFIYYYCAPAYLSPEEIIAYKGTEGTAPEGEYPAIDRKDESKCDAMIVMAYQPQTRHYIVMDAQAYSKETANSQTEGEANTGVDFYAAAPGYYMLSHCYGCRLSGSHRYFIFDQGGYASVYDESRKLLSRTAVGSLISSKIQETRNEIWMKTHAGDSKSGGRSGSKSSGGTDDFDDSDGDEEEIAEAKAELEQATGEKFDSGNSDEAETIDDFTLNGLVKSAVMDGTNVMYFTLMLYTGECPWVSDMLFNRVVNIYSFDLSGDQLRFISTDVNHDAEVAKYLEKNGEMAMWQIKEGQAEGVKEHFTPFDSDISGFDAYIAGYANLEANGGMGYKAMADAVANGGNTDIANAVLAQWLNEKINSSSYWLGWWVFGSPWWTLFNKIEVKGDGTGYSKDELHLARDYMTEAGALKDLGFWDFRNMLYDLKGKSDFHAVLNNYYDEGNLGSKLKNSRIAKVAGIYQQMPERMRQEFRMSLLGYYNRAAEMYTRNLTGSSTSFWSWLTSYDSFKDWWNRTSRQKKEKKDYAGNYENYQEFLTQVGVVPTMYAFDPNTNTNFSDFPEKEGVTLPQAFLLIHGTNTDFSNATSLPRGSYVNVPGEQSLWVEPYEWNEEITIMKPGGWVRDEAAGARLWDEAMKLTPERTITIDALLTYEQEQSKDAALEAMAEYVAEFAHALLPENDTPENRTELAYVLYQAAHGEVRQEAAPDPERSIPAHTYPKSYRLCFPKGTTVQFVDIESAEGSSNTSVRAGALLFSDHADDTPNGLVYTSNITWQREFGVSFADAGVSGPAIDTGAIEYRDKIALLLITEDGVKFYPSDDSRQITQKNAYYLTNEELLSSTGFTPYTESGTQAAVTTRLTAAGLPQERYQDKNQVEVTQDQVAKTLNSSRVGTIQAATSFTMLSDSEVLISAYDTGLTLLRLNENHDVLHLQGGSYYQSFAAGSTGNYKVVGFDTEDYMYGSMDLARAKVYDFNAGTRKQEIYLTAIDNHLDQLAVDYVRRLHRTRTEIEQDAEGKITKQTVVTVDFNDDNTEEALTERRLFESGEAEAINELKKLESAVGIEHSRASEVYLQTLRRRVTDQQQALREVFALTGADKLGAATSSDPYWVSIKERLQATTEAGDFKDIIAEIATSEEMIAYMEKEANQTSDETLAALRKLDVQTYRQFHEQMNYREEGQQRNEVLQETKLGAEKLTELLENRKRPEDFEEQYEELSRGKVQEVDPLVEALNTDKLSTDTKEEKTRRMEARTLVLEDIENNYFKAHPIAAQREYAPNGEYEEIVTREREDVVWEDYISDLMKRINPNNLAAARAVAAEEFAELTWTAARAMEGGQISDQALSVSEETKDKMKAEVLEGLNRCEMLYQVEALFFGTQAKYLGNPYGAYRDAVADWEKKSYPSEAEKAKAMRSTEWYQKLKSYLMNDPQVKTMLTSKGQTWEEYVGAVITNKTGRVLRDEQTGETIGDDTSAASHMAQLVEFLCEGAGNVTDEMKINLVEDLLIGLYTISGAEAVEEAVLIERMELPAFKGYRPAYDAFNQKNFDDTGETDKTENDREDTVSMTLSAGASLRQQALKEQDFYQKVIGPMKSSPLVQSYLKEQGLSWEQYMASLPALAQGQDVTDPALAARKVYENFTPYVPLDENARPAASSGDEERPTADRGSTTAQDQTQETTTGGNVTQ
ncbi:MAG: hypothetical protein II800_05185 [Lachnospiraceae bacterium]|nr:hypothetical protein [Lachnospiraceae bacterium]